MTAITYTLVPTLLLMLYAALLTTWITVAYHADKRLEQLAIRAGYGLLAAHFIWIVGITIFQRQVPIVSLGQISVFLGLLIWAGQTYMQRRISQRMLVLLPTAAVVFLLFVSVVAGMRPAASSDVMQGVRVAFHVTLSLAGLAMLMGAGVYGTGYMILHRQIKTRSFGHLFGSLPSMDELHRLRIGAVRMAWLLITISLLLATVWMLFGKSREAVFHSHLREMGILWLVVTLLAFGDRIRWMNQHRSAGITMMFTIVTLMIVLISVIGIYAGAAA
ncbi:MAG: hypothetical protein ACOZB3_04240 [Calditrichota bacterium]